VAILLSSTLIAIVVDDLSVILSFVGATGSTIVSYLLPGLCYWRLCANPTAPLRRCAGALFLFGVGVMILSLTLILWEMTTGS
jgi:amino acid permease